METSINRQSASDRLPIVDIIGRLTLNVQHLQSLGKRHHVALRNPDLC